MKRSETTGSLAKALAAAQKAMTGPAKDRKVKMTLKDGREVRYNYADLASTIDCWRDPLADHGLALIQPLQWQDGHLILETTLLHESGEWYTSEYPVGLFQRPQDQGTAITYARRYAGQAMLGLASEDDDGAAASKDDAPRRAEKEPAPPVPAPSALPANQAITDEEITVVGLLAKGAGLAKHGDIKPLLKEIGGVDALRALDRKFLPDLMATLERMAAKRAEERQKDADIAEVMP